MAQRHSANAALCLRGLAGVIYNERVNHGHRAGQRFGPAFLGQGHRFPREPFQRAMRTDVDQHVVSLCAKP